MHAGVNEIVFGSSKFLVNLKIAIKISSKLLFSTPGRSSLKTNQSQNFFCGTEIFKTRKYFQI